jgi:hypothetical protein
MMMMNRAHLLSLRVVLPPMAHTQETQVTSAPTPMHHDPHFLITDHAATQHLALPGTIMCSRHFHQHPRPMITHTHRSIQSTKLQAIVTQSHQETMLAMVTLSMSGKGRPSSRHHRCHQQISTCHKQIEACWAQEYCKMLKQGPFRTLVTAVMSMEFKNTLLLQAPEFKVFEDTMLQVLLQSAIKTQPRSHANERCCVLDDGDALLPYFVLHF